MINNRYVINIFTIFFCCIFVWSVSSFNVSDINLPDEHLPCYFNSFPTVAEKCKNDSTCPYKQYLNRTACWGYEPGCKPENSFKQPNCSSHHKGWVRTKEEQLSTFYAQADFGYIREQLKEMRIMCEPLFRDDSSLECSDHLRFCRGRNIMINLTDLASRKEPLRYKMDILSQGQIGGYCTLHEERLQEQCDHVSPLQSWAPELRYFTNLPRRPIENNDCDIVIEKPTFIMKLDAAVNMYHHFCDFFNLYASLHLNATYPDAFTTDVNILIWETYSYVSSFSEAFKAFTQHPILDLKAFRGDVVCFKHVVFPLLPRMIFGLYYNTPIIHGCEGSGLFKAFSEFMMHRLNIPSYPRIPQTSLEVDGDEKRKWEVERKIRITLLSRDTMYRRILNEDELLRALRDNPNYSVRRVVYSRHLPFPKQLEITHQSDIFIGIHGAGLTHLLFLPDWAVLFELYNCEDENCYKDLARLRGIKYITWEKQEKLQQEDEGHHPDGGAHAKFTNFAFDVDEFVRLVSVAAEHVRQHETYKAAFNSTTSITMDEPITLHDEL